MAHMASLMRVRTCTKKGTSIKENRTREPAIVKDYSHALKLNHFHWPRVA